MARVPDPAFGLPELNVHLQETGLISQNSPSRSESNRVHPVAATSSPHGQVPALSRPPQPNLREKPGANSGGVLTVGGSGDHSRALTCRMTLSGWWKLGVLQRAVEFSCVAGHKPRSFRPQVRMLRRTEGGMGQRTQ